MTADHPDQSQRLEAYARIIDPQAWWPEDRRIANGFGPGAADGSLARRDALAKADQLLALSPAPREAGEADVKQAARRMLIEQYGPAAADEAYAHNSPEWLNAMRYARVALALAPRETGGWTVEQIEAGAHVILRNRHGPRMADQMRAAGTLEWKNAKRDVRDIAAALASVAPPPQGSPSVPAGVREKIEAELDDTEKARAAVNVPGGGWSPGRSHLLNGYRAALRFALTLLDSAPTRSEPQDAGTPPLTSVGEWKARAEAPRGKIGAEIGRLQYIAERATGTERLQALAGVGSLEFALAALKGTENGR